MAGYEDNDMAGYVDEDDEEMMMDDEEMSMAERELAEDAQWKIIQKNTFTRWVNQHLKDVSMSIEDLQYDLSDGLKLIGLIEALSKTKFKNKNKRPHFRTQKLENVTMTLKFLEEHEGLKLVNIDSTDITDNRIKLILGLIWTLILHYSISLPAWEGEEPTDNKGQGPTPKQRLLAWINSKMPTKPVKNFTSDWNDGTAIGALVDGVAPGLCPDWPTWDKKKALQNAREAMDAAEQWLDLPQLIRPDEMTNPKVDEKAMMTYLSQFPHARKKDAAPLRPKTDAARVRAYGPGLERHGNVVNKPARFTLETGGAGRGNVDIIILNPKGQRIPVELVPMDNENENFAGTYVPTTEGEYRVIIKFAGTEIPHSPFKVAVEGPPGDPNLVHAKGPGIEPTGNVVGRRTFFNIFTTGAGSGNVDCAIIDPNQRADTIKPRLTQQGPDIYLVEYTPKIEGLHSVNILFGGQPIPKSPYAVMVGPAEAGTNFPLDGFVPEGQNPDAVPARPVSEHPLLQRGPFAQKPDSGGVGKLPKSVGYPQEEIPEQAQRYTPAQSAPAGKPGPSQQKAAEEAGNVYATGRGIEPKGVRVDERAKFHIHTENAAVQVEPKVKVVGPGGVETPNSLHPAGPHLYDCVYIPPKPGRYVVGITYGGRPIPKSPYNVDVSGPCGNNVSAYGPGLKRGYVDTPAKFTVNSNGETGNIGFKIEGPGEAPIECSDNGDGTVGVEYVPTKPGQYCLHVTCNEDDIKNSPFMPDILPADAKTDNEEPEDEEFIISADVDTDSQAAPGESKAGLVKVFGPGILSAAQGQMTHFTVDPTEAGPGPIEVTIRNEKQEQVPYNDKDKEYFYTPNTAGPHYTVEVTHRGQPAAQSPYKVPITSKAAVAPAPKFAPVGSNVAPKPGFIGFSEVPEARVENLAPHVVTGQPQEFDVILLRFSGPHKPRPDVRIQGPRSLPISTRLEETVDGYAVGYTPEFPGPHRIHVDVDGYGPVSGSPFTVVAASASGFEREDAGLSPVGLVGSRPAPVGYQPQPVGGKKPASQKPKGFMEDAPVEQVERPLESKWPRCEPDSNAAKIYAFGDGLEKAKVNEPAQFTIDSREAPAAPLSVTLEGPAEAKIECQDNGDGTCGVTYVAPEPGLYTLNVLYEDTHITDSPFRPKVFTPRLENANIDFGKIKVYGQGLQPHGVYKESFARFTVDAKEIDPRGVGTVKVTVNSPSGQRTAGKVTNNGNGTYSCQYSPLEEGPYKVEVSYDGFPVLGSPFPVEVVSGSDASRVLAYGPGLESATANLPATFIVDLDGAGQGGLGLAIEGPGDTKIKCNDNKDGTCTVEYVPPKGGTYDIYVKFNDNNIPGSPFRVPVVDVVDASKVKCHGAGIQPHGLKPNQPTSFIVDATQAGEAPLQVACRSPNGKVHQPSKIAVKGPPKVYEVSYTPTEPGANQVEVTYGGRPVPGSPFRTQVQPPPVQAHVQPPIQTHAPAHQAQTYQPYQLQQASSYQPPQQQAAPPYQPPQNVQPYQPQQQLIKPQKVQPVQQRAPVVPKGPDASKVRVTGEGVKPLRGSIPASLPAVFTVDTRDAGPAQLNLNLLNPHNQPMALDIDSHGDGTFSCAYRPHETGVHTVQATYGGQKLPESPYRVTAAPTGRADLCRIEDDLSKVVPINQECVITVNTSQAGMGQITCRITAKAAGSRPGQVQEPQPIAVFIEDNGDGTVSVSYVPKVVGDYAVEIRFGGQVIPNGNFVQKAVRPDQLPGLVTPSTVRPTMASVTNNRAPARFTTSVRSQGEERVDPPGYHSVDFKLPVGPNFNLVTAVIHTPSGQMHRPTLLDNGDGSITVQYQPTEKGTHAMEVNYNSRPIPGSPFHFNVESVVSGGHVTAYGPGLSHGRVHQPANFTIVTKNVGQGGLSLAVEGPSKAEIQCVDNKDGTCSASYVPIAPGQYTISIKFQDRHIPGSPFTATIAGDSNKFSQVSVGTTSEVPLKISEADIAYLNATVKSPSGREETCVLKRMPNGHLGISFTPREMGEHLVNVYRNGVHIPNSPFTIYVSPDEIGNASRVRVFGPGIEPRGGMANERAQFTVDTREAGYGSLSLSIEGPSKADIECHDNHDGTCLVTYRPTEPGTYLVNVKYADRPVPGSPFAVEIGGQGSGIRVTERITRQRDAVDVTHVGNQCELNLKIASTNIMDMSATVTSPSGYTELCDITDLGDGHFSIKFIPREVGVHTVSVKHRGIHIPGSPFQFTVGPITEGGAHKVRASGPGLLHGVCNRPNEFSIYTREAGAGGLSIAIEGPSKAEIDFEDHKDGSCLVTYRVSEPGDYLCSIKFNDQHIADSPFRLYVSGPQEHERIPQQRVFQLNRQPETVQDSILKVTRENALLGQSTGFTVQCGLVPDARSLRAIVKTPSGHEFDAMIQQLESGQFNIRFIPEETGAHLIHVLHRDTQKPIVGSPFRVVVGGSFNTDPGMVYASGEGLSSGTANEKNHFFVNTVNAGSGALSVTIDGPSKVQLNCQEEPEGYHFTYIPTVAGEYLITIKYGGNFHIVGSPFKAFISGGHAPVTHTTTYGAQSHVMVETVEKAYRQQEERVPSTIVPCAERIRCNGVALKRAYIGRENQFNVDASQGGTDILLVGLAGPQGPIDEVTIRHIGQQQFSVNYVVKDRGTHVLMVKWGDQHVPGSPFMVEVL